MDDLANYERLQEDTLVLIPDLVDKVMEWDLDLHQRKLSRRARDVEEIRGIFGTLIQVQISIKSGQPFYSIA